MQKIYYTHDNGSRPFKVEVNDNEIIIYGEDDYVDIETGKDIRDYPNIVQKITNYHNIFIGKTEYKDGKGNSLLIKLTDNKYVFIGEYIYEFNTDDNIIKYMSPIGNNDIPYPYAIGEKNIYLMIEKVKVDKKHILLYGEYTNPYDHYYNHYNIYDNSMFIKFNYNMIVQKYIENSNYHQKYNQTHNIYINSNNFKNKMEKSLRKELKKIEKNKDLYKII